MTEAGRTARTPELSEASGDAACLLPAPRARGSRLLLAIVFLVGGWLLLAGWSDAARADPAGLNASCPVAPLAPVAGQSSLGLPVAPAIAPLAAGASTPSIGLPPPPCTAPAPLVPLNNPVTEVPPVTPAVDLSTVPGGLDPSAANTGAAPLVGLPPLPATQLLDPTAATVDLAPLDPALLDPALLNSALLDGALLDGALLDGAPLDGAPLDGAPLDGAPLDGAPLDGAPLDGAPGTALDTTLTTPGPAVPVTPPGTQPPADVAGTLPCSEPVPAPAAVTDTGGAPSGSSPVEEAADTRAAGADRAVTAALPAPDGGAPAGLTAPVDAPAPPVSPIVPVSLPVPPPVPGPAGPAGSASAASSATSCHGGGQTVHGHGTEAVLVAEVAASLAQAALRSTSGFAGAVVGGADDPGVRPG